VYALATPGGWRVLGRTPLAMFDARRGAMLRAGDAVRFQRIGWERYVEMMG
jgi:inhibitor of KinA